MIDDAYRRLVQAGLRPLIEDVPPGPEWADIIHPEAGRAASRRPGSGWAIGVVSAVVVLLVFGLVELFSGGDGHPTGTTSPSPTVTLPAGLPEVFVPPTRTVDDKTILDLTLLDGSQMTLAYPADIDLTSQGVEAQATGGVGAPNRTVIATYGTPEQFLGRMAPDRDPSDLTDALTGPDGGRVERWNLPAIPYIVFDFSPWTAYVWDTETQVGENLAGWAENLHGRTNQDGFLTLTADPPLGLLDAADRSGTDGPDIRIDGASGSLLIFINDCERMGGFDQETYGQPVYAFCDEPTNTLFFVGGDAEIQRRVRESLEVNPDLETTSTIASPPSTPAVSIPPQGPTFGDDSRVLLLLDDGIDGLTAIDLDGRLVGRSVVEGQRAGDEHYSMVKVGQKLVVGWGEPYSVDLATRDGLSLGSATIFVPAAEPNQAWMIDYPGGSVGSGDPQVWQVDVVSGQPVTQPRVLTAGRFPDLGVLGGLVLQVDNGLLLWDAQTGKTTPLEANEPGGSHDVNGKELVWCGGECSQLVVTNTVSLESERFAPPEGYAIFLTSKLSPDGRMLAAVVGQNRASGGRAIWVLDRTTGNTKVVTDPATSVDYLAWAPDGGQLFATSYSYAETLTVVWRYRMADQQFSSVVLPVGGTLSLVVVDSSLAQGYIGDELVKPSQCVAPQGYPNSRSGICTFDY